jgi:hypothetical protein
MSVSEHVQATIERFFTAISEWREGYVHARLSYVGIRQDAKIAIVAAEINLALAVNEPPRPLFDEAGVVAGEWDIPQGRISAEAVIGSLLTEEGLHVPNQGHIGLRHGRDRPISSHFPGSFHHAGLKAEKRLAVLNLTGGSRHELVQQPELDWKLKAASTPFEDIHELAATYRAGSARGDYATLEVIANSAVLVSENIEVRGAKARIGVCIGDKLNRSLARIGFRAICKREWTRGAYNGNQLTWHDQAGIAVGIIDVVVEPGSIVQCIASYNGHAHHIRTCMDTNYIQNPRSVVLRALEQSSPVLEAFLLPELPGRGRASDDFEAAVSWVLWALGFAPASFGLNPKTRNTFDLVANDDRGNFLIVECTLGLLKTDGKLSRLVARAARIRQDLASHNLAHLQVLPVIISAMNRDHLRADLESARHLGVVVLAREDLERALAMTDRFPRSDHWFDEALATLKQTSFLNSATEH